MQQYENIIEPFLRNVECYPDRLAIACDPHELTYRELSELVDKIARAFLGRGLCPQDRVAYLMPNSIELVAVYLAIQKVGAVAVPLNYRLIPREIAYLTNAVEAKLLVFDQRFLDKVETSLNEFHARTDLMEVGASTSFAPRLFDLAEAAPDYEVELFQDASALSRIQFTGGSTGLPKGACRTHEADLVEIESVAQSSGFRELEHPVVLIQCPLEHHGGHSWFASALANGATVIVCGKFNPESILRQIEHYAVSHMILLPPTTYLRLIQCGHLSEYDVTSVRLIQSAAGVLPPEVIRNVFDAFPHADLNYGWGQSESGVGTTIRISRDLFDQGVPELDSVGKPMFSLEIRIVDDEGNDVDAGFAGEALVRTPALMKCYWEQPELTQAAFTQDGWLRTGDVMQKDDRGFLYLKARKKDMIKSGGENVFINEVQTAILRNPAVADCVVFGTADPTMGEAVAAVVQPKAGVRLCAADIQETCKAYIASYKKPRYVMFVDDLGRDDAGKIRLDRVIERFNEEKGRLSACPYTQIFDDPPIYMIPIPSGGKVLDATNVYVVKGSCEKGEDGNEELSRDLIIDTGLQCDEALATIQGILSDLHVDVSKADIFLTHHHFDHRGLVSALMQPGTKVYLSAADIKAMQFGQSADFLPQAIGIMRRLGMAPSEADELAQMAQEIADHLKEDNNIAFVPLEDGDVLRVGATELRVVDTPGHTPGHQCLYMPDQHLMFLGDQVLSKVSPCVAPYVGEDDSDALGDYLDSLKRVDSFAIRLGCMGHGAGPLSAIQMRERIRELRRHSLNRSEAILREIQNNNGLTGMEIAKRIPWSTPFDSWDDVPAMQRWIMANEVAAHLDHLVRKGRVKRILVDGVWIHGARKSGDEGKD